MSFKRYGARERRGMIILLLLCLITLSGSVFYSRCSHPRTIEDAVEYSVYRPARDSVDSVPADAREEKGKVTTQKKRTGKKRKAKKEETIAKEAPRDFMRDTVGRN